MGAVVALSALLVQTPPPRTAAFTATSTAEGRLAELSIAPARAGLNTMTVRFRDAQGRAFDPAEVEIASANAQAGVEPAVRTMRRVRAGEFRRDGGSSAFPAHGRSRCRLGSANSNADRFASKCRCADSAPNLLLR